MITLHGLGHHKHDNPPGYAFDDNHTLHGLGLSNHNNPLGHAPDGPLRLGERMGSFGTWQSLEAEDSAGRESDIKAPLSISFFVHQHHHLRLSCQHWLCDCCRTTLIAEEGKTQVRKLRKGHDTHML